MLIWSYIQRNSDDPKPRVRGTKQKSQIIEIRIMHNIGITMYHKPINWLVYRLGYAMYIVLY